MRRLPSKYQQIYEEFYLDYSNANNFFRKLSLLVERWYHIQAYKDRPIANSILEIGAGNLNHIKFEKNFKSYDVVEPKEFLLNSAEDKYKLLIRNRYKDISEIPNNISYDKVIAIAVIEHIEELGYLLNEISKRLKEDGSFLVEIPAEGEFLWWLGWRLTTGIGFWLKYKLDYGIIMRYEHVNNVQKIFVEIKKYFLIEKVKSFPFNFKNGRLYIHIKCRKI